MTVRFFVGLTAFCGIASAAEITVNSTSDVIADDGQCTLREAIIAANTDAASGDAAGECGAGDGADTISVPAGTITIALDGSAEDAAATGDFDITGDVTITGAGVGVTILDGDDSDRLFDVHGGTVAIADLTLQDGRVEYTDDADAGGCLAVNDGAVELTRITLTSCDADGSADNDDFGGTGGGVAVSGGTLAVIESTISDCRARSTEDGGGTGGGVYVAGGSVSITDSIVSSNQARSSSRGGGQGAGIYVASGDLTLDRATISDNVGFEGGTGAPKGDGIAFRGTTLTITDSTIANNGSAHCSDANGYGGGLWHDAGSAVITGTTFSGNQNTEGAGVRAEAALVMTNSTISGNSGCTGAGGLQIAAGTTTLAFVTVTDNSSTDGAGGVDFNANSTVINSIIAGNADLDCVDDAGTSLGGNILGTDCAIAGGDDTATDLPGLDALADNGGSTQTHAFTDTDLDDRASCVDGDDVAVETDQRGELRGGAACTPGAFEVDPVCGDGAVDGAEACDDGNTDDGDGCSAACVVEGAATCIGAPSVCIGDRDGDGVLDAIEVLCDTDPADAASVPVDLDGDGLCDLLDSDADGDGIDDGIEALCGEDFDGEDGDCPALQGDAGGDVLVLTEEEDAGDNCANGGLRIIAGTDANADGELTGDEIASEGFVCNGGAGGANGGGLIAVRIEEPGERCPNGGVRVQVGTDVDGDGQLGQGEVSTTRFVCNGQDGVAGADGRDGVDGVDGQDGQDGADGADGADGRDGVDGVNGQDGEDGADGVDGVNGQDGEDGADGVDGVNGQDGEDGANGVDGVNGQDGRDGADGVDGVNGEDGVNGVDGVNGEDGVNGVDGANGEDGEDGVDGVNGQDGVNGADGQDGSASLIQSTPLAAGEGGCVAGGLEVRSGIDDGREGGTAGDGTLQDGEVQHVDVLCSAPAAASDGCSVGARSGGSAWWLSLLLPVIALRRRR